MPCVAIFTFAWVELQVKSRLVPMLSVRVLVLIAEPFATCSL